MTTVLAGGNRVFGLADGDERRVVRGMAWMSEDAGSTWRPVMDVRSPVVPWTRPVPADRLRPVKIPPVEQLIRQLPPRDVAVADDGSVLIVYSRRLGGHTNAWRLFNRRGQVVAEQAGGGSSVEPAGRGFLLQGPTGVRFVDPTGTTWVVDWKENLTRQTRPGDAYVPGYGVYRPGTGKLFNGQAEPDGTVSAQDDTGHMWALGRHTHGQTVVRSALAGGPWHSRVLGPSIGAIEVQGKGRTLMVVGKHRMYISDDAGRSWTLVRHDAAEYSSDVDPGGPQFTLWPDGTIYAGDFRAGWRISYDQRTFRDATEGEVTARMIGDLFAKTAHHRIYVSINRRIWFPFTPTTARRLLAVSAVG